MRRFSRFYSWLLRFYPATFRERHARAMEQQFRDEYREAATPWNRFALSLRAIADLAASLPAELANELAQDTKFAFRLYRKRPLPAVLAVAALALSIGAATGLFSVLNAVLLRRLPFTDSERVVELRHSPFTAGLGRTAFYGWRNDSPYLQDAATFSRSDMNLAGRNGARRVGVTETSANFHQLLGMKPAAGRTFASNEDQPGHASTAIVSYSLWQQLFGGTPSAIGSTVELNGVLFTVIGVAPPGFDYPRATHIWIPTVFDFEIVPKRGTFLLQTVGRLKSKVSLRQARTNFESQVRQKDAESSRLDEVNRPQIISVRDELAGPVGKAAWLLAGMILFVLLSACANVAHLLLSRMAERRKEIAVRIALGASHARLIQQLTTEAIVLTGAGSCLGFLVATYVLRIASTLAPPALASQQYTILDARVIGFAIALALGTGIAFGALPGLLASRLDSTTDLVRSQSGPSGRRTAQVRFVLLALQACATLVLLSASITMGRTFLQMLNTDLGFRTEGVVTMTVSLEGTKYRSAAARWKYYNDVLEHLRAIGGVEAAGAVNYLPLGNNIYMALAFKLDSGQAIPLVVTNGATREYFRTIGTRFLAGRDFERSTRGGSEAPVIVNEAFVRAAGAGPHLIGRRIIAPWSKTPYVITGVVETNRLSGPADPGMPMIYWPVEEEPSTSLTFVARVRGDTVAYLAQCRDAVKAFDPTVPVYQVATLEERKAAVLARPRFFTTATLFLSLVALFLAMLGTFGTTAQAVLQRSHEMGIRMALGGSHSRLRAILLKENVTPSLLGVAIGTAVALGCERYISHVMENVQSLGVWAHVAAACLLAGTALFVAWRASARLLAIHPADAIRSQ